MVNGPDDDAMRILIELQQENLKELRKITKHQAIESRAAGLSTAASGEGRARTSSGSLGKDLLQEFVNVGAPSPEYAQSLLNFNQDSNSLFRKGIIGANAAARAARTVGPGSEEGQYQASSAYRRDAGSWRDAGGQYAVSIPQNERDAHNQIRKLAFDQGIVSSSSEWAALMRGEGDISGLESAVRNSNLGTDVQRQMDRIVAGGGARGALFTGARLTGKYLPYAQATVEAVNMAVRGLDTAYGLQTRSAGLGYGFGSTPFSGGAMEVATRNIQTKLTGLRPGLTSGQLEQIRATIEQSGYGMAGQEGTYDALFGGMADITQATGGALSPGSQMQVMEMALRSGKTTGEIKDLVKLLSKDLPAAAVASRMSIEQMHTMLMNTTEEASKSPFNTLTKSELYQRNAVAFSGGAQPAEGQLLAGSNNLLNFQAAFASGQNPYAFQQNPLAPSLREAEIDKQIQNAFGAGVTKEQLLRMRQTDPIGFGMRTQQLEQVFGITTDMLFAHMDQNSKAVQAATALGAAANSAQTIDAGRTDKNMFGRGGNFAKIPEYAGYGAGGYAGVLAGTIGLPALAGVRGIDWLSEKVLGTDLIDTPNISDIFGGVSGAVSGLLGGEKTTGASVLLADGTKIDPNKKGTAAMFEQANKQAIELAKKNMTAEQKKSLETRMKEIVSEGGTYTDEAKAVSEIAGKMGKKEATGQSEGATVTLVLDPNSQAYNTLSFKSGQTLGKSATVVGTNVTVPGSVSGG